MPPVPAPPPVPVTPSSVPMILLAMVNRERGARGVARCDRDPRLVAAAEGHCATMAAASRCGHVVGSGPCAEERVLAAGYAFGRLREAVASGQDTAAQVVRDWMADPDNRAVLLDPQCRHAGFGVAVDADGGHYWTAVLAFPQSDDALDSPSAVRLAPPVQRGGPS